MGAIVIAFVALIAGASTAQAQYPPLKQPDLVISQEIGPPGYTFTATVTNCVPGQRIVFVVGDQRVEATCDPVTMQASATITAPPGLGTYTVTAEFYGDCSSFVQGNPPGTVVGQAEAPCLVLTETIQVVSAGPTTTTVPGGNIATTGSNGIDTTLQTGMILLAVGAGFFVVSRIRRRQAT
jgi:hypothetical protein